MSKHRVLSVVAGGILASALFASTALADQVPIGSAGPVRPGNAINVGDSMNISVTAQQAAGELFHMDYPGNSQPVVINARIDGVNNTLKSGVGFDIYDVENGATPVEHLTLATNQYTADPNLMEFVYSSGKAGPVTVQFFNWSQVPVTLEVMPVQLPAALLFTVGPTIPGTATAVGVSSVAGVSISRG